MLLQPTPARELELFALQLHPPGPLVATRAGREMRRKQKRPGRVAARAGARDGTAQLHGVLQPAQCTLEPFSRARVAPAPAWGSCNQTQSRRAGTTFTGEPKNTLRNASPVPDPVTDGLNIEGVSKCPPDVLTVNLVEETFTTER
jgi:hypothetical protein